MLHDEKKNLQRVVGQRAFVVDYYYVGICGHFFSSSSIITTGVLASDLILYQKGKVLRRLFIFLFHASSSLVFTNTAARTRDLDDTLLRYPNVCR